jgi:endonuclease-3
MTKQEKAKIIESVLDELYPQPPIPLLHQNPFTLLVAVMLSAQSTDVGVNQVTPALFKKGPTAKKMAQLKTSEILAIIKPLGLAPTKAKNVKAMSELLAAKHRGQVPCSFEDLEALPGVGHKTASVVMAQAFDVPSFPVDTHIHRLAYRWGLSSGKNVEKTEEDLKKLFPRENWNALHLQIIYYGREHCPARGHDLQTCRICRECGIRSRI